jgi:hypothetical protein
MLPRERSYFLLCSVIGFVLNVQCGSDKEETENLLRGTLIAKKERKNKKRKKEETSKLFRTSCQIEKHNWSFDFEGEVNLQ